MKFAQLGDLGFEIPVVVHDGKYYDLRSVTDGINGSFLENGIESVRDGLQQGTLPELSDAASKRVGAPIAQPGSIICVGMNYAKHAAESGAQPPKDLVIFHKAPNTISGPHDDIVVPRNSSKTDWEVELGIVVGRRATYLSSPSDSNQYIAGYVTVNDLSERDWQLDVSGGQWSKGKSAPGFCPVGPWLVTADEVEPQNLGLWSEVNGQTRQNSTTQDMIFSVEQIVWELSQVMVLDPGDLILTGTPEGVALSGRFPYLQAGDTVEVEVEGLGRQRSAVRNHED